MCIKSPSIPWGARQFVHKTKKAVVLGPGRMFKILSLDQLRVYSEFYPHWAPLILSLSHT